MNRQIRTQRIVALFLTWLAVILLASRLIDTPAERGEDARGPKRPP